jgi:TolB-like protein
MSLFQELKRRNVLKVAAAYIVISWLLLQVSDTLAPALLLPAWIHSVVAFLLILGFPIALLFAWAIELSPDGLKLESPRDSARNIRPAEGRSKLNTMTLVLLVVALAYFSYDKFLRDPTGHAETGVVASSAESGNGPEPESSAAEFGKSIVVLPFVNMSSDEEQEYFSDGISEELLNLLAKIRDLRVISRTSAFYFKGKDTTVAEISRELNVAYVLEGSVRKSGSLVRITAQLIEAGTDTHLWSQTYDRELSNLFAVQDEISTAIVAALRERLGLQVETAPQTNKTVDTDAYDAYLRGRHLLTKRTKTSIEGAVREFERALGLNPDYALAHAELAIANLLLARVSGAYGDLPENESLSRALPHAERAMALDPNLAEAQAAIGFVRKRQGQFDEAIGHYRRAIEINPHLAWFALLPGSGRVHQGQ